LYYYVAIAITGSIVLGVEVLSSRILNPYFGVSLYIWASILSVTLLGLAAGYFLGGVLARSRDKEGIHALFVLFLSGSSITLASAVALYPRLFPSLMKLDLVAGSFAAALVLIVTPLTLLSALNSLVIALTRADQGEKGDAGAGGVFFISTLGSVAGVALTAFLIIPHVSNTIGLLFFSLATALLACAPAFVSEKGWGSSLKARIFAAIALALSAGLLLEEYLFPEVHFVDGQSLDWHLLAERHSIFGSIKVVEMGRGPDVLRMYVNDGIIQDVVQQDGRSAAIFTYALTSLLRQYAPDARNLLFLGLAAGIVPRDFPPPRYRSEVVEINPDSVELAKSYFGFTEQLATTHNQDARTFVNDCENRFDAIVFDMFHGDGVPDYLLTREFFRALARCGTKDAVVVMNTFDDRDDPGVRNAILATVQSVFPKVVYYWDLSARESVRSAFVVASGRELRPTPFQGEIPSYLAQQLEAITASRQTVTRSSYGDAAPLRDDHNIYSVLSSGMSLRYREIIRTYMPAGLYKN
jgi:spermidine synthase